MQRVGLRQTAGAIDGRAVDTGAVGRCLIGDHHRVFAAGVGEEIENAFFLEQAREEGKIGLFVLHAVIADCRCPAV